MYYTDKCNDKKKPPVDFDRIGIKLIVSVLSGGISITTVITHGRQIFTLVYKKWLEKRAIVQIMSAI